MSKYSGDCSSSLPSKELLLKEAKEDFNRDYGFQKPIPPQSPVGRWDYHYQKERAEGEHPSSPYMRPMLPQEKNLVLSRPSTFKGRRTGSIYSRKK